ncbi:MAG: hypothetical protein F6K00_19785 [Leptolyngbya sp. SIOISBB]|nr:hypothetical protein [Leptolyngbya sp. SIOISBB]
MSDTAPATKPLVRPTPPQNLSGLIGRIEAVFRLLARYDSSFGENGYGAEGDAAVCEGWQHPIIKTYLRSKGYQDRHDWTEHDLDGLYFNLVKLLGRYEATACLLKREVVS